MKTTFHFTILPLVLVFTVILGTGDTFSQTGQGRFRQINRAKQYVVTAPVALIQGDTLNGWTAAGGGPVRGNWKVVDGELQCKNGKKDDIATEKEYENFILDFDWKIAKGGNSGVKYRYADFGEIGCKINIHETYGWLGCEYQILDDPNNPEGEIPNRTTAALYHVKEPNVSKELNSAGEWNHGRIVVLGNRIEHWLNGKKILEIDTNSQEWKDSVAASKFAEAKGFGENPRGHLMLQDHEDGVAFKNITIREINNQVVRFPTRKQLLKK